jgi:hypothetical protein
MISEKSSALAAKDASLKRLGKTAEDSRLTRTAV